MMLAFTTMAFMGPTRVNFLINDWTAAQTKARAEQKLYFVDFDASYCSACRNMDANTYQDPKLADFMNNNVVALRLDVQDFEGIRWSQQYEIEALPTMLIFNQDGKLVKRLSGYKSAKDLLEAFQDASIKKDSKKEPFEIIRNENNSKEAKMLKPIASNNKPLIHNQEPHALGLYELNVRKLTSNGYSIQVGVYSSYEIMLEQAEKLAQNSQDAKILLYVDEIDGQRVYKLLAGNFSDKIEALEFRESLKKIGFDGLLKDLSVMR